MEIFTRTKTKDMQDLYVQIQKEKKIMRTKCEFFFFLKEPNVSYFGV